MFRYDHDFEDFNVSIDGKDFPIHVSKLTKKMEDGLCVEYRTPFAGQGYNRSVLLVNIREKTIYYWGKKTITDGDIKLVNIRKQPGNCDQDWGSISLMEYLEKKNFFPGQSYSLRNYGLWHAIRNKIRRTCHLRSEGLTSKTIEEYEIYHHDFLVDRGTIINCKCERCSSRGLL